MAKELMPNITKPLPFESVNGKRRLVRWDRRVNRWGIISGAYASNRIGCDYTSHFEVGVMLDVDNIVSTDTAYRGCSPTQFVGYAEGSLWNGSLNGQTMLWFGRNFHSFRQLKFNGVDFSCGNQLVTVAHKLILFADGTCMAQLGDSDS